MKKILSLGVALLMVVCFSTSCIVLEPAIEETDVIKETDDIYNWNSNSNSMSKPIYSLPTEVNESETEKVTISTSKSSSKSTNKSTSDSDNQSYYTDSQTSASTECKHSYKRGKSNCEKCNEPHPNVLATSVLCPGLPTMVSKYNVIDEIIYTTEVTKVEVIVGYFSEDEVRISAKFSGTKTYDMRGDSYSGSSYIAWKLYDSEGSVKDSGTFFSPNIAVGESFSNELEILYDCVPGEYRLELVDIH